MRVLNAPSNSKRVLIIQYLVFRVEVKVVGSSALESSRRIMSHSAISFATIVSCWIDCPMAMIRPATIWSFIQHIAV